MDKVDNVRIAGTDEVRKCVNGHQKRAFHIYDINIWEISVCPYFSQHVEHGLVTAENMGKDGRKSIAEKQGSIREKTTEQEGSD